MMTSHLTQIRCFGDENFQAKKYSYALTPVTIETNEEKHNIKISSEQDDEKI